MGVLAALILQNAVSLLAGQFTSYVPQWQMVGAILVYADDGVYLVDPATAEAMPDVQKLASVELTITDYPTSLYTDVHQLDRHFRLRADSLNSNKAGEFYPGASGLAASLAPEYFASTPIGQVEGFDAARLADREYRVTKTNLIGIAHWAAFLTVGAWTGLWWLTHGRRHIRDIWAKRLAMKKTRCASCDYDLAGLPSDRCPECGHARTAAE